MDHSQSHTTSPRPGGRRRAKALLAASAVGLSLVVAGPAMALPISQSAGGTGKQCKMKSIYGDSWKYYPDGYEHTYYDPVDRKYKTIKCKNGEWVKTSLATSTAQTSPQFSSYSSYK